MPKAGVWYKSIIFKGEKYKHIKLSKNSIVVFVGPNNCGKSKVLKELDILKTLVHNENSIVSSIEGSISGTKEDLFNYLEGKLKNGDYFLDKVKIGSAYQIEKEWEEINRSTQQHYPIFKFFHKYISTTDRLNIVNPPENLNYFTDELNHPIQVIKWNTEKEKLFSKYFKLAFGKDVIINHNGGKHIQIHVGEHPEVTIENDRASKHYQEVLRKLPYLHEQGDGMKSFSGVFLSLLAEDYPVNVIDEPEAFLHPPQANLLGQMIAKNLEIDRQLFVATHSEHFLKGLLDSASDRLIVIRMDRNDNKSTIDVLNNDDIKLIWNDSVLRHSNILDGLFHKRVVLSESDSDCKFFNSVSSQLIEKHNIQSPDIHYINCGGKNRFPVVYNALKKINVPITLIGDFDLYNNEHPLNTLYEIAGGKWSDIKEDFKKIKESIDKQVPTILMKDLRKNIDEIFEKYEEQSFTKEISKEIEETLKVRSAWKAAKMNGKSCIPENLINIFDNLQNELRSKDIHVLEVGELESFYKNVRKHGPAWVNKVLQLDIINDPDLEIAKSFILKNVLKVRVS